MHEPVLNVRFTQAVRVDFKTINRLIQCKHQDTVGKLSTVQQSGADVEGGVRLKLKNQTLISNLYNRITKKIKPRTPPPWKTKSFEPNTIDLGKNLGHTLIHTRG